MLPNNRFAIIVAGGSGMRMGFNTPKQFIPLNGKPILMHTLEQFHKAGEDINIHLVLPENEINLWENLCVEHNFNIKHEIIKGGNTRFQSVKNGLNNIHSGNGFVCVHDGVRMFASAQLINKCFDAAENHQAVVPVLPVTDTLRSIENNNSNTIDRNKIVKVQTPQCFNINLLKKAFEQNESIEFTDDASVVEKTGTIVFLIEGEEANIKITTPFDLKIAQMILQND